MRVNSILGFNFSAKVNKPNKALTDFGVKKEQKTELISKNALQVLENKYSFNPSFKGHSEIMKGEAGTDGYCIFRFGNDRSINLNENTELERGDKQGTCKGNSEMFVSVYYADPYEEITPEIRANHSYICYYKEPDALPKKDIDSIKTIRRLTYYIWDLERRVENLTIRNKFAQMKVEEEKTALEALKVDLPLWMQRVADSGKDLEESQKILKKAQNRRETLIMEGEQAKIKREKEAKRREIQAQIDALDAQRAALEAEMKACSD